MMCGGVHFLVHFVLRVIFYYIGEFIRVYCHFVCINLKG